MIYLEKKNIEIKCQNKRYSGSLKKDNQNNIYLGEGGKKENIQLIILRFDFWWQTIT